VTWKVVNRIVQRTHVRERRDGAQARRQASRRRPTSGSTLSRRSTSIKRGSTSDAFRSQSRRRADLKTPCPAQAGRGEHAGEAKTCSIEPGAHRAPTGSRPDGRAVGRAEGSAGVYQTNSQSDSMKLREPSRSHLTTGVPPPQGSLLPCTREAFAEFDALLVATAHESVQGSATVGGREVGCGYTNMVEPLFGEGVAGGPKRLVQGVRRTQPSANVNGQIPQDLAGGRVVGMEEAVDEDQGRHGWLDWSQRREQDHAA